MLRMVSMSGWNSGGSKATETDVCEILEPASLHHSGEAHQGGKDPESQCTASCFEV